MRPAPGWDVLRGGRAGTDGQLGAGGALGMLPACADAGTLYPVAGAQRESLERRVVACTLGPVPCTLSLGRRVGKLVVACTLGPVPCTL